MQKKTENALAHRAQRHFLEELRAVNETSARYGLQLSEAGMLEVARARTQSLRDHGPSLRIGRFKRVSFSIA